MPSPLITVQAPFGPVRLLPLDRISPPDPRDYRFAPASTSFDPAAHYDLEALGLMPPIRDQGTEGSCCGHASSEYLGHLYRKGNASLIFSPAFAYYEARLLEGWQLSDSGAYLRDEWKVLQQTGCCLEQEMPYVPGQFALAPTPPQVQAAASYRIDSYAQIALGDIVAALAQNTAVAVGSYWYNVWFNGGDPQYHILPDPNEQPVGGHAWLICGAQTSLNVNTGQIELLFRHHGSWSTRFGDGTGHVWIPAHVLQAAAYEYWTVTKVFAAKPVTTTLELTSSASSAAEGSAVAQIIPPPPAPPPAPPPVPTPPAPPTPPTPPLPNPQPTPDPQPTPKPASLLSELEQEFVDFAAVLERGGSDIRSLLKL